MAPDLDPRLEDATRQAFTRLFDTIEVAVPARPPAGRSTRPERRRHRARTLALAGAGLAAAAAAVVAVLVVADGSSPGRVSTDGPSTTTTAPTTTSPSTSTTAPQETTTTTGEPPSSSTTSSTTSATTATPAEPGLRPAEILEGLELDGLTDVVTDQAVNGPVTLQVAPDGQAVAMQLSAPWLTGFGPGIEGTPRELEAYWMVSTVDNQHVVWGLAPEQVRQVDVYLTDGQVVSTDTVAFPAGMGTSVFAVVLPPLTEIEGVAGVRADGSVSLAGSRIQESLAQVSQPGPHLREWTAFIPMVVH